jgi:hypothetical protein
VYAAQLKEWQHTSQGTWGIVRQYLIMGESTMLDIAKESAVTALEFVQTSVTLFSRAQAMDIIDSLKLFSEIEISAAAGIWQDRSPDYYRRFQTYPQKLVLVSHILIVSRLEVGIR